MHAIHTVWIYHLKMIFSGLNNIFLFDWLFKWTLRRVHNLVVYSWVSGGAISPQVGPGQSPSGDWGWCPQNSFSAYAYKTEGNEHIKKWDFVLLCATSATNMCTIQRTENSSFVYVKHVFLDISTKGRFKSNKCLLLIKSKTTFI